MFLKFHMPIHTQDRNNVQIWKESVKNFSSYATPKSSNVTQKIGLDCYVASLFDQ